MKNLTIYSIALAISILSTYSNAQNSKVVPELTEAPNLTNWHTKGWQNTLLLNLPGKKPDAQGSWQTTSLESADTGKMLTLLNLINEANFHAVAMNKAIYYLGTSAPELNRVDMGTLSVQGLGILSSRDLMMTRRVKEDENPKNDQLSGSTYMSYQDLLFPQEGFSNSDLSNTIAASLPEGPLKSGLMTLSPLSQVNSHLAGENAICSRDALYNAREGVRRGIVNNWPTYEPMARPELSIDKGLSFLRTYLPLFSEGKLYIDKSGQHQSYEKRAFYFSSPGALTTNSGGKALPVSEWAMEKIDQRLTAEKMIKTDYVTFDHILFNAKSNSDKQKKLQVTKIESFKKFSETDRLHLEVSFGNFTTSATAKVRSCEVVPLDLSDGNDGLLLRGFLHLAAYDKTPKNVKKELLINQFLGKFGVELAVNRVALVLDRKHEAVWETAFEKAHPFDKITSVPEKSVMHLTLLFDKNSFERSEMPYVKAVKIVSSILAANPFSCTPKNSLGQEICTIKFSSERQALTVASSVVENTIFEVLGPVGTLATIVQKGRQLQKNFVSDKIMKMVQTEAGKSIDANIIEAQASLDANVTAVVQNVMQQIAQMKELVMPILAKLGTGAAGEARSLIGEWGAPPAESVAPETLK